MFSRSVIDDSRTVNDNSRVIRMTTLSDPTTWSITYDNHSYNSRGVINDCDIFIIQATDYSTTMM